MITNSAAQISVCASGAAWRDRNCSTPQIDEPSDADLLYMAATLEPRHIWSGVSLLRNRGQLQPEPAEPSAALKGSPPASPSLLPGWFDDWQVLPASQMMAPCPVHLTDPKYDVSRQYFKLGAGGIKMGCKMTLDFKHRGANLL
ncbi:hypothetical protein DV515_00000249 [Chloebia gouldiae]|uniref:Uncharacterized protein n=1 Tax=Chloebia gouldiae TaxID=44316 RepID=A0A3L8T2G9_CHLGU|nr:hypothetical protein DV515_00000249 [Chloebia gouldiae]